VDTEGFFLPSLGIDPDCQSGVVQGMVQLLAVDGDTEK
jgi:hypothetical protein